MYKTYWMDSHLVNTGFSVCWRLNSIGQSMEIELLVDNAHGRLYILVIMLLVCIHKPAICFELCRMEFYNVIF